MVSQEKNLSVEGVRGIACFMVLLSHLGLTFFPYLHAFNGKADLDVNGLQAFIHNSPFCFFFSGTSAVYIFFVLSGFILTRVALRPGNSPEGIFSMGIKRYPRLMIPALASCILAFASFYIFDLQRDGLGEWIVNYGSEKNYSLMDAIYSGVIDIFFLSGSSSYNPVLWTMKIELIGSFIIYIICLNKMVLNLPLFLSITFVLTMILTVFGIVSPKLALGLTSFYGGYLFGVYGQNISLKPALALIVTGLYLAGAHNTSSSYSFFHAFLGGLTYELGNFLSGFFIVYAIIFNDTLSSVFSIKLAVFMGKLSFSVYLIHAMIISTCGVFIFNIIFSISGMYNLSAIAASVVTIVVVYASSLVFYQAIDLKSVVFSNFLARYTVERVKNLHK